VTRISNLALIAAIAVIGMASPTFAQSSNQNLGTGAHHARLHKMAPRQDGMNAFALVPSFQGRTEFDPVLTGGGSAGYNEDLRKNQP
jgi:hypothetical protein